MSYAVRHLIEGRGSPLSVKLEDPIKHALELMWQNDYSQLPVIDNDHRPVGMISHQSILRAQRQLGPELENVPVRIATAKVPYFRPDDDLFDLLDRLKDGSALLIVDGNGKLIGIVTGYDSTEYFRRRSEDLMRVGDIEAMIKDLIRIAFSNPSGNLDETKLSAAIAAVTGNRGQLRGRFVNAVRHLMKLVGQGDSQIAQSVIDQSFAILSPVESPKQFDQLTLQEYIDLLLHRDCHEFCRQSIGLDPKQARKLLEGVRDTRNRLAHFRDDEITPEQREQLRFCGDCLNRVLEQSEDHPQLGLVGSSRVAEGQVEYEIGAPCEEGAPQETSEGQIRSTGPADEDPGPNDSRYAPLALWLSGQPRSVERVQFSLEEIEGVMRLA